MRPVVRALAFAGAYCGALVAGHFIGVATTGVAYSERKAVVAVVEAAMQFPAAFLALWALFAWLDRRKHRPSEPAPAPSVHVDTSPPAAPPLESRPHQGPPYSATRPRRPIGSVVVDCPECGGTTPARTEPGETIGAKCKHCGARFLGLTRLI